MDIRIQASTVDELSTRTKYDTKKDRLSTVIQAEVGLKADQIARLHNLISQGVAIYLVIGSHQGQFDFEMVSKKEEQPSRSDTEPSGEFTRIVMLSDDAELCTKDGSKDFVSLHYDGLSLGPFADICPAVDQLKRGAILKLFLDRPGGKVLKVEMAAPKDIADMHFAEQMEKDTPRISEVQQPDNEKTADEMEHDLFAAEEEAELANEPVENGTKPKRRSRKVKQLPL